MHLHIVRSLAFSTTVSSPTLIGSHRGLLVECPIALGAPMTTGSRKQIIRAGNPDLLPELEIPRSTAMSWIRRGLGDIVSLDRDGCEPALRNRVDKLEGRVAMLTQSCGSSLPCCAFLASSSNSRELPTPRASDACWERSIAPGESCRCRRLSEYSGSRRPDTTGGSAAMASVRSTIDLVVRAPYRSG